MKSDNFKQIADWCLDAHAILAPLLPQSIAELRHATILRFANQPAIIGIAEDLAIGLNDQPESKHALIRKYLIQEHGFSFEYFINRNTKKLLSILARGIIKNEKEYRIVLEALTDCELEDKISQTASLLVTSYELNFNIRPNAT